jgi:hypothetical protein
MNNAPASARAWAKRLLAVEAAKQPGDDAYEHDVIRVCEKLRLSLSQFVGADGFAALLRRALALARADVPSLQSAKVTAYGRLEGLEPVPSDADNGAEAAITITTCLLGLLVAFIGESLTLRLIRTAFPDASNRLTSESEDF